MLTVKEIEDMYGYCAKTKRLLDATCSKQADKAPQPKKLRSIERLQSGCIVYTCDFMTSTRTRKSTPTSWSI